MKYEIDCQVHSYYSPDASESPKFIFERAKSLGLKGVIITDHNTTSHFSSVQRAAKTVGILTCLALEISTNYMNSDIHILAYGNNIKKDVLEPLLARIRESYNDRSKIMLKKLEQAGVAKIDFNHLLKQSKGDCVTKPLIAKNLARLKKIDQKTALAFFERGGVAYVPYGVWIPGPEQAVRLICKAGGKAVLAHPGDFFGKRSSIPEKKRENAFKKLFESLVEAGLVGVEVWYANHTKIQIKKFRTLALEHNLLMVGGSDWHGRVFTPNKEIGDGGISEKLFRRLI